MSVAVSSTYASSSRGGSSNTATGGTGDHDDWTMTQENYDSKQRQLGLLRRENALFLEWAKQKGQDLFPQGAIMEIGARARRAMKRPKKMPQFPTSRKVELAAQVSSHIAEEIKRVTHESQKELSRKRAEIVQIGIREREIEREQQAFVREIVQEGRDERSGAIVGERLFKWYDDLIKEKETEIGKLRLKRDSVQSQITRTRARLQQKLELGEKLQQVDYDQLQINNEAFLAEIAELSQRLAALQKISSSVVSRLNATRMRLVEEERAVRTVEGSTRTKEKQIDKYTRETDHVESDHGKLVASNEDLASKKSEFRVPEVSDYIDKRAKIYELVKVIRNWERKVQLATMNVKRLKAELARLDAAS